MPPDPLSILDDLVRRARAHGADAADGVAVRGVSLSHNQRLGQTDGVERSEGEDIGLRVFVGQRQAIVSGSDTAPAALDLLAERAVLMARVVPEDAFCGLAPAADLAQEIPDLDLDDPAEPAPQDLAGLAAALEDAARAVPGITNSEGASASWGRTTVALVTSNGFAQSYASSHRSLGVSVLAGEGTSMEADYDYATSIFADDLPDPAKLGRRAGERTVRRLGAERIPSTSLPVIFEPRIAGGFLSSLAGAITGPAVARGTSFLKDSLGKLIFADGVNVIDDPLRRRGLRSRAFDGEGLPPHRRAVIADGQLTTWLLDLRSARQLGLTSTGHASRGTSGPPSPSPSNLYMEAGSRSPEEMIGETRYGLYVTSLMGQGVNMVTGDYSRGATGILIENGQLTKPVTEVTIAGNLKDMLRRLEPASDLVFRYGIDSPTVRIDGMSLAGS
ncbi:MAG: TldD/PmbA family protein [Alphaproteobacteria bacterium]